MIYYWAAREGTGALNIQISKFTKLKLSFFDSIHDKRWQYLKLKTKLAQLPIFYHKLSLCYAMHMIIYDFMLWQWSPQVVTANKDIFFAKWRTFWMWRSRRPTVDRTGHLHRLGRMLQQYHFPFAALWKGRFFLIDSSSFIAIQANKQAQADWDYCSMSPSHIQQ